MNLTSCRKMDEKKICFKYGNSRGMECFNENEYVCKMLKLWRRADEIKMEDITKWDFGKKCLAT